MAAYSTLIDGSKWFSYGIETRKNVVNPIQWQAQHYICRYNGHISISLLSKDFGRTSSFPSLKPYFLGEHSLRLYKEALRNNLPEELLIEALIFNCHKVYPPGDKYSPELSEKGQNSFDIAHIRKNRKMIKSNSIYVRKSLGLDIDVSEDLIDLNKIIQANELYFLQQKTDEELETMGLPKHSLMYDVETGNIQETLIPLDSQKLSEIWWEKFRDLDGWKRFDRYGRK